MKTLKLAILALSFGVFAVSCGDTATETPATPEVETPATPETPETPAPTTPEVNPADTNNAAQTPAAQTSTEATPEKK